MIGTIEVKVCGITSIEDALAAERIGADELGFNFYPPSPRAVSLDWMREVWLDLPGLERVAVVVEPEESLVDSLQAVGFEKFQVHFDPANTPDSRISKWFSQIGRPKLCLAPKLAPGAAMPANALTPGRRLLWDAYRKDLYGGTGSTSDWERFQKVASQFPEKEWVLAGGLSPDNVGSALDATGATRIDLNSGVEKSPGKKDQDKLLRVKGVLDDYVCSRRSRA